MAPERVTFDELPPDGHRQVWAEWLRFHGIDPDDVTIPGWIERDEQARTIRYRSRLASTAATRLALTIRDAYRALGLPLDTTDVEIGYRYGPNGWQVRAGDSKWVLVT